MHCGIDEIEVSSEKQLAECTTTANVESIRLAIDCLKDFDIFYNTIITRYLEIPLH